MPWLVLPSPAGCGSAAGEVELRDGWSARLRSHTCLHSDAPDTERWAPGVVPELPLRRIAASYRSRLPAVAESRPL